MGEQSLYDRLGGAFAIAAVVDKFSDALITNPKVGQQSQNPQLSEWSTDHLDRLPGLKFMRTLWVCNVAGGPFEYVGTRPGATQVGLEEAHRDLQIAPEEFDEVAAELGADARLVRHSRRERRRRRWPPSRRTRARSRRASWSLPVADGPSGGLSGIEQAFYSALRELRRQGGLPDQDRLLMRRGGHDRRPARAHGAPPLQRGRAAPSARCER